MIEHGIFMDDLPIIIHMWMIYLFILDGLPFIISDFSFDSNPTWFLRGKRGGKGSCPQLGCDGLTVVAKTTSEWAKSHSPIVCSLSYTFIDTHSYQLMQDFVHIFWVNRFFGFPQHG